MGVDLRAAAVHHHDPDSGVAQEDHVFGERLAQRLLSHRVPAVLHHHRAVVEALEPRKRLDQRARCRLPVFGAAHVEYAEFSWTYAAVRSLVQMVAPAAPAPRSTVMSMARPLRSSPSVRAAGAVSRHTQIPLIATASVS